MLRNQSNIKSPVPFISNLNSPLPTARGTPIPVSTTAVPASSMAFHTPNIERSPKRIANADEDGYVDLMNVIVTAAERTSDTEQTTREGYLLEFSFFFLQISIY